MRATASSLLFLLCACAGGPVRDDGFPVVTLRHPDRTRTVALRAEYGFIVDWPAGRAPAFYVFDRSRRSRFRTERWDDFLARLRALPDGIAIDRIGKCTVPFAWGMPDAKQRELDGVLRAKRMRLVDPEDLERHTRFCYCESLKIEILHDGR